MALLSIILIIALLILTAGLTLFTISAFVGALAEDEHEIAIALALPTLCALGWGAIVLLYDAGKIF